MIKGLSQRRRLTRAGVIRLGIKVRNDKGVEYPKETNYFVCPDLVREKYGGEPKQLLIMFPVENEQIFFQQFYKKYGNGILLCKGDGEIATCYDFEAKDFVEKDCPCPELKEGSCRQVGVLQFLLPEIEEAVGVWQISTGSTNSIVDLNSGIDFVRGICGRIAMIPLILKREEITTQKLDNGEVIKGKHYTMKLSMGMSLMRIQQLGLIPPTQALIPSPVETQKAVEDLYPKNGFDPDQKEEREPIEKSKEKPKEKEIMEKIVKKDITEAGQTEAEQAPEDHSGFNEAKKELRDLVEKLGGFRELTDVESVKLDSLITLSEYQTKIIYYKKELSKVEGSK